MSKLMEELMAEIERVNGLQTEVDRAVANQTAQIKADRDVRMERPRAFLIKMGWTLGKLGDNDPNRGYYPDIPLDVFLNGKQLYINYSIDRSKDGKRSLYAYGGYHHCIEFRVGPKGIYPDYPEQQEFVNAIIDQWNDECERNLENRVATIIKETITKRVKAMQKKLTDSNDEYAKYFGKE